MSLPSAAPAVHCSTGPLSDSADEVKKLHVKCHYYCTRTTASVSSVPRVTENRDISTVSLSFWGSEENVVLPGVQDLSSTSCLLARLWSLIVGKLQGCYAKVFK